MREKNFVVSFNNDDDNVNSVLTGYNRQIMEIMMQVNKCDNYNIAQNKKTTIIYEYISENKRDIEYIIYIYIYLVDDTCTCIAAASTTLYYVRCTWYDVLCTRVLCIYPCRATLVHRTCTRYKY